MDAASVPAPRRRMAGKGRERAVIRPDGPAKAARKDTDAHRTAGYSRARKTGGGRTGPGQWLRIRPGGHRSPPGGERGPAEGAGPSLPHPPREAAWRAHARSHPAGRCDTPFHPRPRRTYPRIRKRADGGHGPPHRPGPGRRPHDHGEPGPDPDRNPEITRLTFAPEYGFIEVSSFVPRFGFVYVRIHSESCGPEHYVQMVRTSSSQP